MDIDLESRIERALTRGHPEVDRYRPGVLDLSRHPTTAPDSRLRLLPAMAAAAVVVAAIAIGSVRFGDLQPSGTPAAGLGATGSLASPTPSPSATPGIALEIVENPESELMSDLSTRGIRCFATSSPYSIPPNPTELDRQIKEAGIVQGWLIVGSRWVGSDLVALARAFGATRVVAAEANAALVWILIEQDGRAGAFELVATETPRGFLVWGRRSTTFETDCEFPTPPPISIIVVKNPREAAMEELLRLGARCFQGSDILTVAPDGALLDRQIRDTGIDAGWLQAGSRWVGEDPTPMVLALGSDFAVAGPDERHLWTVVSRNGTLTSREYRAVITPNGHWVWIRGDMDQAIPC